MVREAQEEAGIKIDAKDLRMVHVIHRKSKEERIDFFFTTDSWQGEITNKEPHKCDDLSWFALENLPTNIVPEVRQALEQWQKGEVYSEFGW